MAIDDNTSYELTGAQVKDLANKIKAKAADNIFVGATSAAPGSKGLVPQPQAGDDTKFLSGDGTWKTIGGTGGTIKLVDVPYTSFTTSASTSYQLDLRTLFCNSNANREFYFDALLVDIELFTPVQSSATYFRFGTLSTSTACHRRMITFGSTLSVDSNDAPNIILSANGELSETLIVTPVNVSSQTDVDSVPHFAFSHYAGTQYNDDFRFNVGSFVRLENMPNGKVPCFIETAPTAGKMTIYGVRYGR